MTDREPQRGHGVVAEESQASTPSASPGARIQFTGGGAIPAVGGAFQAKASSTDPAYAEDAQPVAGGRLTRFDGEHDLDLVHAGVKTLHKGDRSSAVRKLQVALMDLGFEVNIHGVFDDRMVQGVTALQARAHVTGAAGEVDAKTLEAIEARIRSREAYANAAKETKPNHRQFDTPDAAHPPAGIVRHTHTLSDAEKAEAGRVLAPDQIATPPFVRASPEGAYEVRLAELLHGAIKEAGAQARKRNQFHDRRGGTYGGSHVGHIGTRAKQAVDRVFGSFKIGDDFHVGINLHDKHDAEQRDIDRGGDAKKQAKALDRVDKILNTDDAVKRLGREHSVQRGREPEEGLIQTVRLRLATELEDDLVQIMLAWPGSANDDGVRIAFRRAMDGDDRTRLWDMFGTLVHEYIHTLEHPAWHTWRISKHAHANPEARASLREGVPELLTRTVLAVTNVNDPKVRKDVEGEYYEADADPVEVDRNQKYATETGHAEQLVGVTGIHNLYAAYFVGQTQLVGGQ